MTIYQKTPQGSRAAPLTGRIVRAARRLPATYHETTTVVSRFAQYSPEQHVTRNRHSALWRGVPVTNLIAAHKKQHDDAGNASLHGANLVFAAGLSTSSRLPVQHRPDPTSGVPASGGASACMQEISTQDVTASRAPTMGATRATESVRFAPIDLKQPGMRTLLKLCFARQKLLPDSVVRDVLGSHGDASPVYHPDPRGKPGFDHLMRTLDLDGEQFLRKIFLPRVIASGARSLHHAWALNTPPTVDDIEQRLSSGGPAAGIFVSIATSWLNAALALQYVKVGEQSFLLWFGVERFFDFLYDVDWFDPWTTTIAPLKSLINVDDGSFMDWLSSDGLKDLILTVRRTKGSTPDTVAGFLMALREILAGQSAIPAFFADYNPTVAPASLKARTSIDLDALLGIAGSIPNVMGRKFLVRWAHTLQLLHWWIDEQPHVAPHFRERMEAIVLDFHEDAWELLQQAQELEHPSDRELQRIKSGIGRIARQKAIVAAVALQMTIFNIEPQDEAFRRQVLSDKAQRKLRALLRNHLESPALFRKSAQNMGFLPNGSRKHRRRYRGN